MSTFPPQAFCGTDNRPPDQQSPHGFCGTHRFVRGGKFCDRCGEAQDDPGPWNRQQRQTIGFALLVLGLLLGAFALYVHLCHTGSALPGSDWVLSWVDRPVRSRSGRETAGTTAVQCP